MPGLHSRYSEGKSLEARPRYLDFFFKKASLLFFCMVALGTSGLIYGENKSKMVNSFGCLPGQMPEFLPCTNPRLAPVLSGCKVMAFLQEGWLGQGERLNRPSQKDWEPLWFFQWSCELCCKRHSQMKNVMQALGPCRELSHVSWDEAVQSPSETDRFTVWAVMERVTKWYEPRGRRSDWIDLGCLRRLLRRGRIGAAVWRMSERLVAK